MSMFSDTVLKAIGDYRQLLRRHLPDTSERKEKLEILGLNQGISSADEALLYQIAHRIVKDIEENLDNHSRGYYAYSGVRKFAEYLRSFLEDYAVQGEGVVHCMQQASRALLQAIQLLTLPGDKLSNVVADQLTECGEIIANYGSSEQQESYRTALQQHQRENENFYGSLLRHFQAHVESEEFVNYAE
ncbi:MAG TPA: hypothetical protein VJB02_04150 [Coxiellaceae bacterium]|nr:hypothetical protein [Coxiellaceae bacterium]